MFRRILLAAALCFAAVSSAAAHGGAVMIPVIVPVIPSMPAKAGNYDSIHTVAVISSLGAGLTLTNNHFMGPKTKILNIDDWQIDNDVSSLLKKYLGSRFTFKDVPYDRAALAKIPNGRWDNYLTGFSGYLHSLPNDGIDAFIVVRPDLEYQAPGIIGLALENGNAFYSDVLPVVWANYEIELIDAHTYSIIGMAYSRVSLRAGEAPSFAGLVTTPDLRLDDNLTPTDTQMKILHAVVSKVLDSTMVETLRAMQLGVSLPEAGARTLAPIPPDKRPYPTIKTIAIASAVGDQLELKHWGAFFARGDYQAPITDWHIDATIEAGLRQALSKSFTVKDVPIDRQALLQAHVLNSDGKLDPAFPGLTQTQDVDAYLVVLKITLPAHALVVSDTTGLGVWNFAPVGDMHTGVFADYVIVLVDAHTLKLISAHTGVMSPDHTSVAPYVETDNSLWPTSPPTLSDSQAQQIRSDLQDILADSLPETLLHMGLTDMMVTNEPPPAPGVMNAPAAPADQTANPSSNSAAQ